MLLHATQTDAADVVETSLGWMAASFRGAVLTGLTFDRQGPREALAALRVSHVEPGGLDEAAGDIMRRLLAYAGGAVDDFLDVEIDLGDYTDFQRRVVRHCRRIPRGATLSYGELAERAGSPRAARAVGNVMRANRFPLIVPCHRVVAAAGKLGGFSSPRGLSTKRKLLRMEGALCGAP